MSVSQAAEAMAAAAEQINAAKSAIVEHRGSNRDWRSQVTDAHAMSQMASQAIRVVVNLSEVMGAASAATYKHHYNSPTPDGGEWPQAVAETAREAAQKLNRARNQLVKLHIHQPYHALSLLHAALQNAARDANRQAS